MDTSYRLSVISKHPAATDRPLVSYDIDGQHHVGVFGDERYAIRFENLTSHKVQVRLSIDGTDIVTGQPASTAPTGQMWVVQPYRSHGQRHVLELEAWPEGQHGGGRFVFTHAEGTVAANTHGVTRDIGIIAAAVFIEGAPIYAYPQGILRSKGIHGQSCGASYDDDRFQTKGGLESMGDDYVAPATYGARSASPAGTGVGEYVEQHIGSATGLRLPKFDRALSLRTLWWDDLVAKLRAAGIVAPMPAGAPGFPGDAFQGIDLTGVPRQRAAAPAPQVATYRRVG